MPGDTALYYPSSNPPHGWLRTALLFYNRVALIVPPDRPRRFLEVETEELLDADPRLIEVIPSQSYSDSVNAINLETAEAIFLEIGQQPQIELPSVGFELDFQEQFYIPYHRFTHKSKISSQIEESLRRNGLIKNEYENAAHDAGLPETYLIVDERASGALLSMIAEHIGRRRRYIPLTDEAYYFGASLGNSLRVTPHAASRSMIANAIINTDVPFEIEALGTHEYLELRKRHESIREEMSATVAELSTALGPMNEVEVQDRLEYVADTIRGFEDDIKKARSSLFGNSVSRFVKFTIGLASAALTLVPEAAPVAASTGAALTLYEFCHVPGMDSPRRVFQGHLAQLRDDIRYPSIFRRLTST